MSGLAFMLAGTLWLSPPEHVDEPPDTGATTTERVPAELLARLESARQDANSGVDAEVLAVLAAAIAEIERWTPALSRDAAAREALLEAKLCLARGYAKIDGAQADAVLDAILLAYRPPEVAIPSEEFGTSLHTRLEARRGIVAARGTATFTLSCPSACEVSLDTHPVAPGQYALSMGPHVVWVRGRDGASADTEYRMDVGPDGARLEIGPGGSLLELGTRPLLPVEPCKACMPCNCEPDSEDTKPPDPPPPPNRRRGLQIMGTVLGAGAVVGGATFLAFDGRCPDGGAPQTCARRWDSLVPASIAVGLGTAALITMVALPLAAKRQHARLRLDAGGLHF
jgi:hypothetical protein